jgi:hypothetical protein
MDWYSDLVHNKYWARNDCLDSSVAAGEVAITSIAPGMPSRKLRLMASDLTIETYLWLMLTSHT